MAAAKRKRKRIHDHAFQPSPSGRHCVHRAPYGWIANVACGWPKSAHAKQESEATTTRPTGAGEEK